MAVFRSQPQPMQSVRTTASSSALTFFWSLSAFSTTSSPPSLLNASGIRAAYVPHATSTKTSGVFTLLDNGTLQSAECAAAKAHSAALGNQANTPPPG
eukprot:CAMPEP_0206049582 /NCGR_PEP_ID=MMETSP1466-20131121/27181_1 /ASSEMBLY_ACC=CAM_ASM_001126 /TAXON_ID=44452 /ORGANISM="Pavlova gyrans, Strain CCMP608" /LENGTH=97 /DNA_ID=CAMNT_0053424673 /DNA_START=227 /DNA_END=521 /DNA_ORIENTATION=-